MEIGQLISGRYECTGLIGQGAMGEVWRARDTLLGRDVAVKRLLFSEGKPDPAAIERSMREARIAARLNHRNAVSIFDVVNEDGIPMLVMELVNGESLKDVIARRGRLSPVVVAKLGRQLAAALAAAHKAGITHRDVKPANVLLSDDGEAKLTDFGIAKDDGELGMTSTGTFLGTPSFLAPEVALGGHNVAASDVWSLGALLYNATEGQAPFSSDGGNVLAVLNKIATSDAPPPQHAGPLTPSIVEAMRREPSARPTATTIVSRFDSLLASLDRGAQQTQQTMPRPSGPSFPPQRPAPMQTGPQSTGPHAMPQSSGPHAMPQSSGPHAMPQSSGPHTQSGPMQSGPMQSGPMRSGPLSTGQRPPQQGPPQQGPPQQGGPQQSGPHQSGLPAPQGGLQNPISTGPRPSGPRSNAPNNVGKKKDPLLLAIGGAVALLLLILIIVAIAKAAG